MKEVYEYDNFSIKNTVKKETPETRKIVEEKKKELKAMIQLQIKEAKARKNNN